tara:strand:- start:4813 stop:5127 length:315 start_codon:yes stop_codon:yes gene_type:complete
MRYFNAILVLLCIQKFCIFIRQPIKLIAMSNYIKVFTGEINIAQRIISDLEKENIIPVVKDQTDSGLTPLFGSSNSVLKQVFVHKDELERATPIIENLKGKLQS